MKPRTLQSTAPATRCPKPESNSEPRQVCDSGHYGSLGTHSTSQHTETHREACHSEAVQCDVWQDGNLLAAPRGPAALGRAFFAFRQRGVGLELRLRSMIRYGAFLALRPTQYCLAESASARSYRSQSAGGLHIYLLTQRRTCILNPTPCFPDPTINST